MTRKDFVALASVLAVLADKLPESIHWHVCEQIADRLKADNPAFDCDRFYVACNLTGERNGDHADS